MAHYHIIIYVLVIDFMTTAHEEPGEDGGCVDEVTQSIEVHVCTQT